MDEEMLLEQEISEDNLEIEKIDKVSYKREKLLFFSAILSLYQIMRTKKDMSSLNSVILIGLTGFSTYEIMRLLMDYKKRINVKKDKEEKMKRLIHIQKEYSELDTF